MSEKKESVKENNIEKNYKQIKNSIPQSISITVAAKTRTTKEVLSAINAGTTILGYNYVQEANQIKTQLEKNANRAEWHMIGHLQKNKINRALKIFDVFQTIDSYELANEINKRANKQIPILIEINSGEEKQKAGVLPNQAEILIRQISNLKNIKIIGLMTMGTKENPELCFKKTKQLFDYINSLNLPNVQLKTLSMGMSNSYPSAITHGSTMIRVGTAIFENRKQ